MIGEQKEDRRSNWNSDFKICSMCVRNGLTNFTKLKISVRGLFRSKLLNTLKCF